MHISDMRVKVWPYHFYKGTNKQVGTQIGVLRPVNHTQTEVYTW